MLQDKLMPTTSHNRSTLTWGLPWLFVVVIALAMTGCGGHDQKIHVTGDSPYFGTLAEVAGASAIVLEGEIERDLGIVPLQSDYPELSAVYGYRLLAFRVHDVRGQAGGPQIGIGDVITIAVAAVQPSAQDLVGNYDDIATRVAGYSLVPPVATRLTIIGAPFTFSNGVAGWTVTGSSYGVLVHDGREWKSLAPLGPLNDRVIPEHELADALKHLGLSRIAGTSQPYTQPSGGRPRARGPTNRPGTPYSKGHTATVLRH